MASNILAGDQLNFTRMGIASVDEIKIVLADILRCEIKPQDLPKAITLCSELTTGRHKLRPEQLRLCCSSPPAVPDYNRFDVSLLYTLIRNLCPQLKPTQGWSKTPSMTDLQVGDDIERLRDFRNEMFAHLDSSSVEDIVFTSKWRDLEQIFQRMQTFLNAKGISVDYGKKLAAIARSDFGFEDMEKYKIILEGILHILKENGNNGGPSITIHGKDEVSFGEKTCFQALLDQCSLSNNWPITWEKIQGNITEQLDTSREKYRGSSSRCLVIADVSKEDEGEYRAVISRENNGTHMKIPSNSKRLTVIGDCPTLTMPKEVEVPYGSVAVLQPVIEACPPPKSIEWQKSKCMDPNSEDYKIFDLTKPKYLGSTLDQTNSKLVINDTSFEDGLFYRLLVENMVGKSTCSTFLNVVGTPPNVIMKDDTDFQERSVTLICKILCESTHPLTGVVWTKDNSTIDVLSCNGKYTGGGIENPSLTINNLNASDAGVYQCCVSNIVGSTHSEQVILAVPNVKLLLRDRDIGNKVLKVQASIKSVPDAFKVEWKVKMTPGDEFRPINIHEETYMGTTISLPNPLLTVNKYNAKNLKSYRIEVTNFLGVRIVTSQEALEEKELARESGMDCLNGVNLSIYKDNGIKIRFNNLRRALIEQISGPEMIILKDSLKEIEAVDEESVNSVNSVTEFLNLLKHNKVFTDRDVITMQYLMRLIKRPDLEQKCIDFATSRKDRLCYFQEKKHADGCSRVRLHVVDDIENFIKLESLIETVAAIVECDPKSIQVVGVIRESSFIIVIEVEGRLVQSLLKNREEMLKLAEYKVDRIEIDGYVINIEKTEYGEASFSSETTSIFFGMKLEEEFFALFRKVLLHYQPTHSFGEKLRMYKKILQPLLNPSQYRLLYLQPDISFNVYECCDIPLMYILFKTICGISPHRNGWGNPPDPSDNCLAADIDRIMEIYGMYCGYTPRLSLTKSNFGIVFKSAVDIMLNIEKTLKFTTWEKTSGPKGRQREDGHWLHSTLRCLSKADATSGNQELDIVLNAKVDDKPPPYCINEKQHPLFAKQGVNLAFYKDKGAKIRFNNLRLSLIKGITKKEMAILKDSLKEIVSVDKESLNNVNSTTDLVDLLKYQKVFTDRDVITMQYLLRVIERPDLERKCIEYATNRKKRLCYFEEEIHAEGCKRVKLHVLDNIENFEELDPLIDTVAAIVQCDRKYVEVVGILPESSFFIVIEVENKLAQLLSRKTRHELRILADYKIDKIYIDGACIEIAELANKDSLRGSRNKYPEKERETRDVEMRSWFDIETIFEDKGQRKGKNEEWVDSQLRKGGRMQENESSGDPSRFRIFLNWVSSPFSKVLMIFKKKTDLSIPKYSNSPAVPTSSITIPGVENVNHISCVTSDRLWISANGRLLLVDSTGHVIQGMKFDIQHSPWLGNHSVTEDGDLILINGDKVKKMKLDGTITTLFEEPKNLLCIHSSRINGDTLVGYQSGVVRYDWTRAHRIYLKDLVIYPIFITENNNGDIWVSDRGRGAVLVMNKSGRHRFDYRGRQLSDFSPGDICTDILGQVLVCDFFDSSVHLVDQDGQFLRLLLTRHGLQCHTALCVDDKNNLYVGEMFSKTIKVYKYLHET